MNAKYWYTTIEKRTWNKTLLYVPLFWKQPLRLASFLWILWVDLHIPVVLSPNILPGIEHLQLTLHHLYVVDNDVRNNCINICFFFVLFHIYRFYGKTNRKQLQLKNFCKHFYLHIVIQHKCKVENQKKKRKIRIIIDFFVWKIKL